MKRILFVCLGNICRSPMAEFIFRDMVEKKGLSDQIVCASAATGVGTIGDPVYPPARRKLQSLGIDPRGKTARQLTREDYEQYDLLLGMDGKNIDAMKRICGGDPQGKIRRLLDDAPQPRDIADPWFTGDFDQACLDIQEGGRILLDKLAEEK